MAVAMVATKTIAACCVTAPSEQHELTHAIESGLINKAPRTHRMHATSMTLTLDANCSSAFSWFFTDVRSRAPLPSISCGCGGAVEQLK